MAFPTTRPSLSTLPRNVLLLHPIPNTVEPTYTPESIQYEEKCRVCTNSGLSIHLTGDPGTASIVMIIDFGNPEQNAWRVHIDHELWVRVDLNRAAVNVEQLFEVHPLGWASEPHMRLLRRWGVENGVIVSAMEGNSCRLFMKSRP